MKISEEKRIGFLKELANSVVFDKEGTIIDSTYGDTLIGVNVFDLPFFMGIQESILEISPNKQIKFECVYATFFGVQSYYDLTLEKIKYSNGKEAFLWNLFNFGRQYSKAFQLARIQNGEHKLQTEIPVSQTNFLIKTSDNLVNVNLSRILYFEAYGDYVKIHTEEKTYIHYNRMKRIEARMPSETFMRVHRSFIINLDKISQIEKENVQIGDRWIPVSAANKSDLHAKLNRI